MSEILRLLSAIQAQGNQEQLAKLADIVRQQQQQIDTLTTMHNRSVTMSSIQIGVFLFVIICLLASVVVLAWHSTKQDRRLAKLEKQLAEETIGSGVS